MDKRVIWPHVIIGVSALAFGVLFYVLERPASQTYFVPGNVSLYDHNSSWFGLIGNYLPDFLHAFAFCLITVGVLGGGQKVAIKACLFWLIIDELFEIGQHATVAAIIVPYIPGWFAKVPVLENTANYFTKGRFDMVDMLAILLGVVVAYALSRVKRLSE